jgi:nickel and cobalt resistance protein CnrR
MSASRIALVALVAFVAAIIGSYAGRTVLAIPNDASGNLHALMHDDLGLDAEQERELTVIEADFKARRQTLEDELRSANAILAKAVAEEHVYGPRVSAAVDATHHAMGALQKATLEHVFAMRGILRPDQQARFDAAVDKTLTAAAQ